MGVGKKMHCQNNGNRPERACGTIRVTQPKQGRSRHSLMRVSFMQIDAYRAYVLHSVIFAYRMCKTITATVTVHCNGAYSVLGSERFSGCTEYGVRILYGGIRI